MSRISPPVCQGNPGRVEAAHTLFRDQPEPPTDLRRRRETPDNLSWLEDLLDLDPTRDTVRVWRFLNYSCLKEWGCKTPSTWRSTSSIRAELERKGRPISLRNVQLALKWLEEHGWIARREEPRRGRLVKVIWCLWLLPDDMAGNVVYLEQGVAPRIPDERPAPARRRRPVEMPPPLLAPGGANSFAWGANPAPSGAKEFAPDSKECINVRESNVNVHAALPGGGTPEPSIAIETRPDPEPGTPADPPAPTIAKPIATPTPAPARIRLTREECLAQIEAHLAGPMARWGNLVAAPIWDLIDQGFESDVPVRYRGEKLPKRPVDRAEGETPSRPTVVVAARPTVIKASVVDLIHRLCGPIDEASREALIREASDQMAEKLRDYKSRNGFISKLRLVATDPKRYTKHAVDAWKIAESATTAAKPGSIFMGEFSRRISVYPAGA